MLRIPLPWLASVVALVLAFILWDKSSTGMLIPETPEVSEFPYAYMTAIETLEYDAEGKLRYQVSTRTARHFQLNPNQAGPQDYSLFDEPRLVFYSDSDTAPWYLSATLGRSNANGEEIRLIDNVEARQDSSRHGVIEVTTSELLVKPVLQYAETDKAVNMRAQQSQIETVGMHAFLNEDRIEFLSQVRGVYAP